MLNRFRSAIFLQPKGTQELQVRSKLAILHPSRFFFHVSLNHGGHWGIKDDFTTSFLHLYLSSTALWDLADSSPVHSQPIFCLLCLLFLLLPFTAPCKMVLTRPDLRDTSLCQLCFRFYRMVRRSSCGPIACWILAQTSPLVTWSLYEILSISYKDHVTNEEVRVKIQQAIGPHEDLLTIL